MTGVPRNITRGVKRPDLAGGGHRDRDPLPNVQDPHTDDRDHPSQRKGPVFVHQPRDLVATTNSQPAPFVWVGTSITPPHVKLRKHGMGRRQSARGLQTEGSSTIAAQSYVQIGRDRIAAPTHPENTYTSVPVVAHKSMVLTHAPQPNPKIRTPLVAKEWRSALENANILDKYPRIPDFLTYGADAGIPRLHHTFTPPNHPSIATHRTIFAEIVNTEFQKGRYWGPFSKTELENIIGPFQTSPLSLIPKSGKPGKFRLIQNLSYPRNLSGIRSINSSIDSDLYPCTWGTFATTAIIVRSLPPGSLGACRDVSEAYRIIPLAEDQWPGVVVRLEEDSPSNPQPFALNTCTSFGKKSSGGLFGLFGDALLDIFRGAGIGPSLRWVDDFVFFLLLRCYLSEYNKIREKWKIRIEKNGGMLQKGGRFWFKGEILPNDQFEEFAEDMSTPLHDLSAQRDETADSEYAYSMEDVDDISSRLGVPWERSKDVPFGKVTPFIGFDWDIERKTVSLQEKKKEKYRSAVEEWRRRESHTLDDVQKLYGKLLHTCLVIPEGRAYLTKLENMLGIFHDTPHKPRHPPRHTNKDLLWWLRTLSESTLTREVPGAQEVIDVQAFSDASSSVGVGIVIGDWWNAWTLKSGWNIDGRDIVWAEAVGMELLIRFILTRVPRGTKFKVYRDNRGVVEGWWSGRSRNAQANEVFKRIHYLLRIHGCALYTKYVPSASNPADGPSRGIFPNFGKLLPSIDLPRELEPFIFPLDHAEHGFGRQRGNNRGVRPEDKPQIGPAENERRRHNTSAFKSQAWELFETESSWKHI